MRHHLYGKFNRQGADFLQCFDVFRIEIDIAVEFDFFLGPQLFASVVIPDVDSLHSFRNRLRDAQRIPG